MGVGTGPFWRPFNPHNHSKKQKAVIIKAITTKSHKVFKNQKNKKGCVEMSDGINEKKVSILGHQWRVLEKSEESDDRLAEVLGYCDQYTRTIVVSDMKNAAKDPMAVGNIKELKNKTLRHEIIHAVLGECGLRGCSEWAENEEMVDWFAIMIPELLGVMSAVIE